MCSSDLPLCIHVHHMTTGALQGQKRVSDPRERELKMVVIL